jgi:hypothetical protein
LQYGVFCFETKFYTGVTLIHTKNAVELCGIAQLRVKFTRMRVNTRPRVILTRTSMMFTPRV